MDKAAQAQAVLNNPLFNASFKEIQDEIIRCWLSTAPDDVKSREWFHMLSLAAAKLNKLLSTHMQTGKMAGLQMEQERTKQRTNRRDTNA